MVFAVVHHEEEEEVVIGEEEYVWEKGEEDEVEDN